MIHPRSLLLAARLPGLVFGLLALLALLVGPVLALAPTEAATWADFSPGGGAWIGTLPATSFVKDLVNLNENDNVIIDPKTQKTSCPGVWAAGDCTDCLYAQNNIAVGDAIKAIEDIYRNIRS